MPRIDAAAFARDYFGTLARVFEELPKDTLAAALGELEEAHRRDAHVFIAGNGGSAATASHMASDMLWGLPRAGLRGLRATSLTDNVPVLTAVANDAGYEKAFTAQLEVFAKKDDLLVVISASGNSPNIVAAAEYAKAHGLRTVGFLGMGGGKVRDLVDVAVIVPADDYGPVEDLHMIFDHLALAYLKVALR